MTQQTVPRRACGARWLLGTLAGLALLGEEGAAAQATGREGDSSATTSPEGQRDRERRLQRERASADAMARARTHVATGDTSGAIRVLREAVERDRENGPLWFEYGSLLSAKSRPHWRKSVMPAGVPNLVIAAESSLAIASRLTPDSVHYAIAYGKHLWGTNATSLGHASRVQRYTLSKLEGGDDGAATAEVADQLGIMMWRRFQPMIGRGLPGTQMPGANVRLKRRAFESYVNEIQRPPERMFGLALFEESLRYFRLARETMPDVEMYFRHEGMLLAERGQWAELAALASQRIRERPAQPWPWLARGLSEHRRGMWQAAQASFDSGFARLPEDDRARLTSISRLLQRSEARWYDTLSTSGKGTLHELYWNTARPSMLLPVNPVELEFRARTVYAELRFTDDEMKRNGTATNQGEIYMRYGPPDAVYGGNSGQTWFYLNEMMQFTFQQNWGYGTAFMSMKSWVDFDSIRIDRPAAWTNLPVLRHRIDSVSAQVVRFRATGDSVDVAVFAGIRTGALRREAPFDSSTIRHGVFFVDELGRVITRTAGTVTSSERDTLAMHPQEYFVRTRASAKAVRIEALEPDLLQVARSITDLSGFTTSGFGVSDLLIAADVAPSSGRTGERWNDHSITSLTGSMVPRGAPLSLLWESYEPGNVGGKARLRFAVTVQRETDAGLRAVASKVIGSIRGAVTRSRPNDRLTISYDREIPVDSVLVDGLRLDLGRLDPGRYRVSLVVTDLVRNASVQRSQRFVITAK